MEETRIQILYSLTIVGRKGRMAAATLLSGNIEEDTEPMEMVSEAVGDKWRVSVVSGFIDPPSPKRQEAWNRGERSLWFVPHGEMRELPDGEIFRTLPTQSSNILSHRER
ncbi:MAG TPA: hypothetical protein VKU00_05425 [Chthonomonadaceae bacterium]|nr:hypothetical protein [Chthonomonadaceae bacterium]